MRRGIVSPRIHLQVEFYYWLQRRGLLGEVSRNDLSKWHIQYALFVDFAVSKLVSEYSSRASGMQPDIHIFMSWADYHQAFPAQTEVTDLHAARMKNKPSEDGHPAWSVGRTGTVSWLCCSGI